METEKQQDLEKNKIFVPLEREEDKKIPNFPIDLEKIEEIFRGYDDRTFDQDLLKIGENGKIEGITEKLKTNVQTGISTKDPVEISHRIEDFGDNKRAGDELPHFCEFVWEIMEDTMLRILTVAAIIQIGIGVSPLSHDPSLDWIDGLSITFAVVTVVLVGSITNYQKEKKFMQLNDKSKDMVKIYVRRDGSTGQEMHEDELLVGDIIKIDYGNIIPADGLMVEGNEIRIDESSMTGETDLCLKSTYDKCIDKRNEKLAKAGDSLLNGKHIIPSPVLYSGTMVKEGNGWMLVLAVGKNSKKGKIEADIIASQQAEDSKTPLENKLEDIADDVGKFGVISAIFTLVALGIRLGISESQSTSSESSSNSNESGSKGLAMKIIRILILSIAIIVVAIPEGLPLAVTLSLSFSISKMMDDNNLVRKMQACETMGGANFICSDKTGTLTKNLMTVNVIFDGNENVETSKLDAQKVTTLFKPKYFELLKQSMALNMNVEFDINKKLVIPSKTDNAFALFLESCKENIQEIREKFFPNGMAELRSFPFTSDRKKMSVLVSNEIFPTKYRIYTKGASEIILSSCKYFLNPENLQKSTITDEHLGIFGDTIRRYARLTLRTICLAYKDISQQEYEDWEKKDSAGKNIIEEDDFNLIGIVGIKDTLRDGVDEAVSKCHTAGITVVMVTGDNIDTAIAIAKDCKILKGDEDETKASMLGSVFNETIGGLMCETCGKDEGKCQCPKTLAEAKKRNVDPDKLRKDKIKNIKVFEEVVSNLKVLARSRPEDKYTLVLGLRQLGNVVAVTGDGTNDAPALSRSDVGFSMGIQGTDIAKNASDIIILDDNFNSIVKAVLWGRNIFDNIRKFIKFQLTVNIAAVALVFVCVCVGNETPITTIQMLWLNMIMDSLGSLALATEPPYDKLLFRKPYSRDEYIISNMMWKHILPQSLVQFVILLILYLQAPHFVSEEDSSRLLQATYLRNCFGKVPGVDRVNDVDYIISGLSFDWDPKKTIFPNATEKMCPPYYKSKNLYDALYSFELENGNTVHMTIVFNTFVLYTLFNQINARVLTDDLNIFERIFDNTLFIAIIFIEGLLQAIIITFGGRAFQCSTGGLTARQWGKCIGFALLTLPTGLIMKFIPMEKCLDYLLQAWEQRKFCKNKVEVENQDESKRFVEEDAPVEMVQVKNSEAVQNLNHNYNVAPPNNGNNNLIAQGILN